VRILLRQLALRRQVAVVACVLLLPFALAIMWSARQTRIERQTEVREEAVSVATTAAAYLDEHLKGLDALVSALVRHPAVLALDSPACDRLFTAILHDQPLLTNLLLVAPDGSIHGSGLPLQDGRVSQPWLAQALKTGKPQVGEFEIGAVTGRPTVPLAYPVLGESSSVIGVLDLTIDLTQLQAVFAEIPLPPGSVITVVDRADRILVRSLNGDKFVGTTVAPMTWDSLPRTTERTDVDGVQRLNGDTAVKRAPWMLTVGIPQTVVAARLAPLWQRNLAIALSALAGFSLLSLWFARLLSRHLDHLRSAARRIADGDLSPLPASDVPNLELAQLQDAFATMATNLREARNALDRRVEQEHTMNETLQSLQRQVVRRERLAAVGLLASGVAHELNNPLQAILGASELLERHEGLTRDALDEIQFVKAQSARARDVIRSLSRFSSQQIGPPSPLDLRDVVKDVLQLRSRDLKSSTLTVDVQSTTARKVYANLTEIEQVTLNFVLNAHQAVEAEHGESGKGRIEIRLFDVGKSVRLEVHDNGPGVGLEDEPKLFQPFFTTRPVGSGTGLGLSVSYGIIDSYGGEIGYFRNPWGGATFFYELTALDPSTDVGSPRAQSSDVDPTHDRPAVLRRPL
jgi:C4-dicarboxylate-specific signal transduction histidine kinase